MQANPKHTETQPSAERPAAEPGVAEAPASAPAYPSPARALQGRLVRELSRPAARRWVWHSAGLVLTAILSLWLAGLILNAGI
ncbi:hypothetical protein [Hyphomonas sp.]|jgi:hypothetical protein|uniref:hypothetical protein n=1 Tax=Hyphomonas sp. TaxID=87 RepID=UPI0025B81090|nr:hypothetical protein [Hyphomonas sp.]